MKVQYDKHRKDAVEYKPGDKVWLEGSNLKSDRPMKKLGDKRFGPLTVLEKIGDGAYKLEVPRTWKRVHNVFNETLLSPYKPPSSEYQPRNTRPPPVVTGDEPEYEVEEIVDSRKGRGNSIWYKVKWTGYGAHEMTWEPKRNITNAKDALKDFHAKYPNKPFDAHVRATIVPISLFPKGLWKKQPECLTEPIDFTLPSENMLKMLARGTSRPKEGVL
jgi:hypothetical protein